MSPQTDSSHPTRLSVSDLSVTYGRHKALKNLSLDIKSGELVGVIGPNGAGKTTFIKALCGRVRSNGVIKIDNKPIKKGQDRRKTIGLVPQDIGLYPQLTVSENLDVISRLLGLSKAKRKTGIDTALTAVSMQDKKHALVQDLSGGMKRRINVAAAIMHDPSVVIFDEPTAGVDIPARDTVHRLAQELASQGKAVILITHELEQAEALCDKILLLVDGEARAFSAPAELLMSEFKEDRAVRVRFASPPTLETIAALRPFEFKQGELPTIWEAMTQANEVSFVSAFMTSLKNGDNLVSEITVRRPGLNALMHRVQSEQKTIELKVAL